MVKAYMAKIIFKLFLCFLASFFLISCRTTPQPVQNSHTWNAGEDVFERSNEQNRNRISSTLAPSTIITTSGQEKFALVIGNSNYTHFGNLQNPINDANDMKDVLSSLGFNVDLVLDGDLNQMEASAIRLRNRLSEAGHNSIGLFYFAGHGLQMGGINYLIPSNANIPDSHFLRERAFSVQVMLDMLNDSRNALNIVILDACRDFPTAWSRSLNRGCDTISP